MRQGLVVVFVACLIGGLLAWLVIEKRRAATSSAPPIPVSAAQATTRLPATAQPGSTTGVDPGLDPDPYEVLRAPPNGDPQGVAHRLSVALEIGYADAPVRLEESAALTRQLRELAAAGKLPTRELLILEVQIIEAANDRTLSDVEVDLLADLAYGLTLVDD